MIRIVGRYALHQPIASGGMATVHLGRLLGPAGFARTVAIKQLHAQFATDPEFVSMFLDEARLAARIRSPHVVPIVDIVADGGELLLVMDYVQGESLVRILRSVLHGGGLVPLEIAVAVMAGALHGLHAAHEATDEHGQPLGIVHRDVSPQNILVGTDGLARLLDFGVAKAAGRIQTTREGQIKGKIAYMAPEQLRSEALTRKTDIYAAAVVLWETLTCRRLFRADNEGAIVTSILHGAIEPPSHAVPRDAADAIALRAMDAIDAVVLRGLDRDPAKRFETAVEMATALEACVPAATATAVGEWVRRVSAEALAQRAKQVVEIESGISSVLPVVAEAKVGGPAEAGVAVTQASSISVAKDAARAGASSSRRLVVIGAVLVGIVAAVPLASRLLDRGAGAGATPPLPPASAPETAAATSSTPSGEPAPPGSGDTLSASATEIATPAPSQPPRHRASPASPHPQPTAKDCNPPYYWDPQGKKHYKPSCL
jgi:serine/threonine-protein kinase